MTDIELAWLTSRRDHAAQRRDLAATLLLDDELEDHGMPATGRRTCWTCQTWRTHPHDPNHPTGTHHYQEELS